jgi:hypothetical protein
VTRSARIPVLAALAAAAVAMLVFTLLGGATSPTTPPSGDPPPGAAISEDDRKAVDAVPVQRGLPAPPPDPGVDFGDPEAVARAYLVAAHSTGPDDAGHTHLRGAAYAVPGSAPATVGVVVLDPPPPGSVRTATVTALQLAAADHDGHRRGYRAEVGTATSPPGGTATVDLGARYVVLALQADSRWLVTTDSVVTPDLPAGEN